MAIFFYIVLLFPLSPLSPASLPSQKGYGIGVWTTVFLFGANHASYASMHIHANRFPCLCRNSRSITASGIHCILEAK